MVALAGSIRCLSVHDGGRRWESDAVKDAEMPLIAGEVVIAVGKTEPGAAIVALGTQDGEVRWRRETAGSNGSASLRDGVLCVAVSGAEGEGRVLSLDRDDGSVKWELQARAAIRGPVSLAEDAVVFRADGKIHVLNLAGERMGLIESNVSMSAIPAPVVAPGVVVVADGRRIRCIDTATLDPIWETKLPAPIDALLLDGERVLVTAGSELMALGAEE